MKSGTHSFEFFILIYFLRYLEVRRRMLLSLIISSEILLELFHLFFFLTGVLSRNCFILKTATIRNLLTSGRFVAKDAAEESRYANASTKISADSDDWSGRSYQRRFTSWQNKTLRFSLLGTKKSENLWYASRTLKYAFNYIIKIHELYITKEKRGRNH